MKNFNEIKKLNEAFKENIESNNYFKQYLLLKWQLEAIYLTEKMSEVDRYIKENDFKKIQICIILSSRRVVK